MPCCVTSLATQRCVYLLDDTPIDPAAVGAKVLLCPISNVSALRRLEFDLVTNTFSMQEMTDEWVDWYMRWLDMQPCRYFYSANFFGTRFGENARGPKLVVAPAKLGVVATALLGER